MHQVRLAATSALGSWEVLPAERVDFLKPAVARFSPLHWQGRAAGGKLQGRGGWWAAVAPRAARKKGPVRWPCVPHPFPNSKEEEQANEALSLISNSIWQSLSQKHFIYLIILGQIYT